MSSLESRAALMQELEHALRRSSGQGAIYSQTVADRAGISSSDMDCLDFLNLEGRVTAGRLAEVTGLTTGAITGVIDRLERAGLVRRERDGEDRRKVFIAIEAENVAKIGRLCEPMQRAVKKEWEAYSDAELKLLLRFANQSYQTMLEATANLKAMIEAPKEGSDERTREPEDNHAAATKPRRPR